MLDVVFIPPESKLIKDATAHGCIAIPGTRMLVHQALFQFELYTGVKAPFEVMERALLERIRQLQAAQPANGQKNPGWWRSP